MTLPVVLLGLAIALLIGFLFHILRGGSGWRLLLYLGMSILGFALGQWGSMAFGWSMYKVGALDVPLGITGSVLILVLGDWFNLNYGSTSK
ncbi:MAG: hypothetical protein JNM02_13385 [Anaerolineales bacterium]|nr:hypothetical protein [Anaerolineales bacterium]